MSEIEERDRTAYYPLSGCPASRLFRPVCFVLEFVRSKTKPRVFNSHDIARTMPPQLAVRAPNDALYSPSSDYPAEDSFIDYDQLMIYRQPALC